MTKPTNDLERQIDAAYDFRGHVTLTLKDGSSLIGFIFNREFSNPKNPDNNFIEVIPQNTDERRRINISDVASVEISGKDFAAGNSFEDYLKKKAEQGK